MNKLEFINLLGNRLSVLPPEDVKPILDYYMEAIADRMEDGMSEEDAIASLGSVDELAEKVLAEPLPHEVSAAPAPPPDVDVEPAPRQKRRLPLWAIVLLVIGSPVWLGIGLGIVGAAIGVYVAIWSVLLSLVVAGAAMILSGLIGAVAALFAAVFPATLAVRIFIVGACLLCGAAGFLLLLASIWLVRLLCQFHVWVYRRLRKETV